MKEPVAIAVSSSVPSHTSEAVKECVASREKDAATKTQCNQVEVSRDQNIVDSVMQRLQKPHIPVTQTLQQTSHILPRKDMEHNIQEERDTTSNENSLQNSTKQGKFYGLSPNESLSFFTPTYQCPKENVDFPNFVFLAKCITYI